MKMPQEYCKQHKKLVACKCCSIFAQICLLFNPCLCVCCLHAVCYQMQLQHAGWLDDWLVGWVDATVE